MVRYKLNNGNTYTILENRDLFDLIEIELGTEIANRIKADYEKFEEELKNTEEDYMRLLADKDDEISDLQNEIENLGKELNELKGE